MTKAAVAKTTDENPETFRLDPDVPKRAEILERARTRLVELRFKCAIDLADPARRGNSDLPIDELARVQNAIDAIDKAIADDRGRGSKNSARPS
jgi:hypothetical protein